MWKSRKESARVCFKISENILNQNDNFQQFKDQDENFKSINKKENVWLPETTYDIYFFYFLNNNNNNKLYTKVHSI